MKATTEILALNRGRMSTQALGRIDLQRTKLSAEIMTNWIAKSLGPMSLRPGLQYLTSTRSNAYSIGLPFVFAADDAAIVDLSGNYLRVLIDGSPITRPTVTAAVSNGTFDTNLTSWTDADEGSASSVWVTSGYMGLTGTGTQSAIRRQQVTVIQAGTEHALRIVVTRGPVTFKVGSSAGSDDYVSTTTLQAGTHSLAFTPSGDFHIQFSNRALRQSLVDSVSVEGAGVVTLPTPWIEADLDAIRIDQSGDVLFVACDGYQQRRIERRSTRSWSIVLYQPEDGPFRVENTGPVTIVPSALSGNITLVASDELFESSHVGALFRLTSTGQTVEADFTGDNQFSSSIRVIGVDETRRFTIVLSGTFTANLTLQRSVDDATWEDITPVYTIPVSTTYLDGLDNQIIYYRIGVKTGDYTSGTAEITLSYPSGSSTGVVRITSVTNAQNASAEVLSSLGGTGATDIWSEGAWSDYRGWPSSVALHEGRLWWAGKDKFYGSITDAFDSFDPDYEGDAGPISRSIGSGPVDVISWLVSTQRLLAGTDGSVVSCRSSSFDEPLTPTNFNPKVPTTQGSARVAAVKIDDSALFVQRGGSRVFEMAWDGQGADYAPSDLTELIPTIGSPGIVSMAVQRQPDTRVHFVRSDGTVALLIFNKVEKVACWSDIETDGLIEAACVLPGAAEDEVYYYVKRTINGSDVRYIEKFALESECIGGTLNKQADSFVLYSGASSTTITGLSHLEGETVVVWGNGKDLGTYVVGSGQITGVSEAVTSAVVGLTYTAQFKSMKLAYGVPPGVSALGAKKRVNYIGLLLENTHAKGIEYGDSFTTLNELPDVESWDDVAPDHVWEQYDKDLLPFGGNWDTDARVCLQGQAPRPCTVLAVVIQQDTSPK